MSANRFNGFTDYGIGIGLRATHYDHILCMDEENLRDLKDMAPGEEFLPRCPEPRAPNILCVSDRQQLDRLIVRVNRIQIGRAHV